MKALTCAGAAAALVTLAACGGATAAPAAPATMAYPDPGCRKALAAVPASVPRTAARARSGSIAMLGYGAGSSRLDTLAGAAEKDLFHLSFSLDGPSIDGRSAPEDMARYFTDTDRLRAYCTKRAQR